MNNYDESADDMTITLRYNRNERLKRASKAVQRMYEPDYIPKYSLFGALVATKASRSILFALVLVFICLLFSFVLPIDKKTAVIRGIPVHLETSTQSELLVVTVCFDSIETLSDIPLSVYVTATDSKKNIIDSTAIHAFYMGSPLNIPAQFAQKAVSYVDVVIVSENKTISLQKAIK